MKTPLGTEVDLGPDHIVLHGVPAFRKRGTAAPHLFGPCLLCPWSPISATGELLLQLTDDQTTNLAPQAASICLKITVMLLFPIANRQQNDN